MFEALSRLPTRKGMDIVVCCLFGLIGTPATSSWDEEIF
jgi:hypothetical protein